MGDVYQKIKEDIEQAKKMLGAQHQSRMLEGMLLELANQIDYLQSQVDDLRDRES